MQRDYHRWHSRHLGQEMELLVFGHAGTPVVVFPSSLGRFHEWEDFGMVGALADKLEAGQNRLICVDSVDEQSFYNKNVDPYVRICRHRQYEGYIVDEVLALAHTLSGQDFVMAAGASFGAYHAANFVFKYPERFGKLIALSGSFDIKSFMDGFYDDNVYFNNPLDYLPNLNDHVKLEALRRNHLVFSFGEFDPCRPANERIGAVMTDKNIGHTYDMVHGVFGHDWPYWREMVHNHIT